MLAGNYTSIRPKKHGVQQKRIQIKGDKKMNDNDKVLNFDSDGDGELDSTIDFNNDYTDNVSDLWLIDSDGDGVADDFITIDDDNVLTESFDTDGDGIDDLSLFSIDTDGDGIVDAQVTEFDFDGDKLADVISYDADLDGDGYVDFSQIQFIGEDNSVNDIVVTAADTDFDGDIDLFNVSEDEDIFFAPDDEGISEEEVPASDEDIYDEITNEPTPVYSTEEVDIDGDGDIDGLVYTTDFDGDGVVDATAAEIDVDGDGDIDVLAYEEDTNGDGFMDAGELRFVSDDRTTDYVVRYSDTDGDGTVDEYTTSEEESFFHTPDDLDQAPSSEPEVEPVVETEEPSETVEYLDTDGDGVEDTIYTEIDSDGNGAVDTVIIETDSDGDGYTDAAQIQYDRDGDGYIDATTTAADTDGDGIYDTAVTEVDNDFDGDVDVTVYEKDTDGDGVADITEEVYAEEETVPEYNEEPAVEVEPVVETEEPSETVEYLDTDGDGVEDTIYTEIDSDGNGAVDTVIIETDSDGDGYTDAAQIQYDRDGDGYIDATTTAADTDGDGIYDTAVTEVDNDFDGDVDVTVYEKDTDGDGVADITEEVYAEEETVPEYNEETTADDENVPADDEDDVYLPVIDDSDYDTNNENGMHYTELGNFDPSEANPDAVIGDPEEVLDLWEFQGETNRCAVYSQKFVIEEYTGQEVDIEELCDLAEENGWFDEDTGTYAINMDKLLDYYGVPNETSYNNTITDLEEALADGKAVIVAVDAEEYWAGENDGEGFYTPGDGMNHAVEVIGIDNSDPDNPMVILNDSGNPYGQGCLVPMDTFIDAWEDSDCFMIECM